MNIKITRNVLLLFVFFYFSLTSTLYAACGASLTSAPEISFTGTYSIQRDLPVGSLIATGETTVSAQNNINTINAQFYVKSTSANGYSGVNYNGAAVHNTNVAGVGLAFWSDINNGSNTSGQVDLATRKGEGDVTSAVHYALVKTGDILGGTISGFAIELGYVCLNDTNTTSFDTSISITGGAIIQNIACTVLNTSINVPMGAVNSNQFSGVGSTAGEADFSIPLDCQNNARVNVTIAAGGGGELDTNLGVIGLDGSSTNSEGIGIQILYNNVGVVLNGEYFITQVSNPGLLYIPFTARYYQVSDSITAGTANGSATFTMTYN